MRRRKSSSQRFDGYKVHIAEDLDTELITHSVFIPSYRLEQAGMQVRKGGHGRRSIRAELGSLLISNAISGLVVYLDPHVEIDLHEQIASLASDVGIMGHCTHGLSVCRGNERPLKM